MTRYRLNPAGFMFLGVVIASYAVVGLLAAGVYWFISNAAATLANMMG